MKTIIIVLLLFIIGCRTSRTLTTWTVPPTSVTTRVDSSVVKAPKLAVLPRAGMAMSFPEAVRRYERAVDVRTVLEVVEIELTGERAVVRTRHGETVHKLPPSGEMKIVRPDSAGRVLEYVEGEPEAERVEVVLPEEPGLWERFKVGVLVIVVLLGLVLALAVVAGVRRVVG